MVKTLPTIRAANLLPIVRWMDANGRPTHRSLDNVGLGCWFNLAPEDPIPLINAISFLRNASDQEGPDLPCRVVSSASVGELAYIGRIALGTQSPRESLTRVARFLPMHSSHEDIVISDIGPDLIVRESWRLKIDERSLHAIHVMLASMVNQICSFATMTNPSVNKLEIIPHPEHGVEHLRPWFGNGVVESKGPVFSATISSDIADRKFRIISKDRLPMLSKKNIAPLAEDKTLAGSIRPVLESLLHGGEPTIVSISEAMNMSVRTLQRQLAKEGTNFSSELEIVRCRLAKKMLLEDDTSIDRVCERLGYSSSPALSRAVRRMTGRPPSELAKFKRSSVS
ncbi:helix-turn-helix transcriptional regulator [Falsihalocynthiibacter sp. SS001]|uniref:helix-turn-helix transcriptional regulator n=1 Tax=Falsihalocynthiibacter sp. SS001 TaxID=3349698 RepID=UPI0036D375DA